jgi:hypothetical protein
MFYLDLYIIKSLDLTKQDIERAAKVNIGAEWLTFQLKDAQSVRDHMNQKL